MSTALVVVASGRTGTGDIDFVSHASITVERNDRSCPAGSAAIAEMTWTPLDLSESQTGQVRRLLIAAMKANEANEAEAARHGQATGGVPGCMSAEFRLIFGLKDVTQRAIVHLCGGWVGGDPKVGSVIFSDKLMVQHYIEEIGQPDHLRLISNSDVFTPTGRPKIGVIWDLSVKKIDDRTCEFTNTVHSSATPELMDFLGKQGIPWEVFQDARKPVSEANNRQETPLFAKSIERHALRDK